MKEQCVCKRKGRWMVMTLRSLRLREPSAIGRRAADARFSGCADARVTVGGYRLFRGVVQAYPSAYGCSGG